MGIQERRDRERARRRDEILQAAFRVATSVGWAAFSVEKVAAEAELSRGTIYTYFADIDSLVAELAKLALADFSQQLADADSLSAALDVPVRFAQRAEASFSLLFPQGKVRPYATPAVEEVRFEALDLMGSLQRVVSEEANHLPADTREAAAFLAGIGMAGALVPELQASTTLRHRWQDFCLGERAAPAGEKLSTDPKPDKS